MMITMAFALKTLLIGCLSSVVTGFLGLCEYRFISQN